MISITHHFTLVHTTDFQSDTGSLSPALSCIGSSPPDSGNKVKRLRTAFTTTQLRSLEYYFRVCPYPDNMGRDVISRVTGIDESKIQVSTTQLL